MVHQASIAQLVALPTGSAYIEGSVDVGLRWDARRHLCREIRRHAMRSLVGYGIPFFSCQGTSSFEGRIRAVETSTRINSIIWLVDCQCWTPGIDPASRL